MSSGIVHSDGLFDKSRTVRFLSVKSFGLMSLRFLLRKSKVSFCINSLIIVVQLSFSFVAPGSALEISIFLSSY